MVKFVKFTYAKLCKSLNATITFLKEGKGMLVYFKEVYFDKHIKELADKLIESIEDSTDKRFEGIDAVYDLFADAKSIISFDMAAEKCVEYGAFEYLFNDFRRDLQVFKDSYCLENLADLKAKDVITLSDLDSLVDSYIQLLKEERRLYETASQLITSRFFHIYISRYRNDCADHACRIAILSQEVAQTSSGFYECKNYYLKLKKNYLAEYQRSSAIHSMLWIETNTGTIFKYPSLIGFVTELHRLIG